MQIASLPCVWSESLARRVAAGASLMPYLPMGDVKLILVESLVDERPDGGRFFIDESGAWTPAWTDEGCGKLLVQFRIHCGQQDLDNYVVTTKLKR